MYRQTVGFTLGCFDLIHSGHINLFERAKGICDKLIVGVLSDEYIDETKKNIMFDVNERILVVKAIRYCDVVVEESILDKLTLWNKYKFDYLFVGDDWINTQQYKKWESDLREVDCKVIYYPYTKGISSSKIKNII